RSGAMRAKNQGLTSIYNRFHDPRESSLEIIEFRALHVELDSRVALAYGWDDLKLDHDFHETPQGLRYTVDPLSRVEILDRLLELNHDRYREEVEAGIHVKKKSVRGDRIRAEADQGTLEITS